MVENPVLFSSSMMPCPALPWLGAASDVFGSSGLTVMKPYRSLQMINIALRVVYGKPFADGTEFALSILSFFYAISCLKNQIPTALFSNRFCII